MDKIVLFDLGGVIINLKNEKKWLEEDLYPNFEAEKLQNLLEQQLYLKYEKGVFDSESFRSQLFAINKGLNNSNQVDILWNKRLADIPKEKIEILEELSNRYPLYLLSNTNEIHYQYIIDYSINNFGFNFFAQYFEHCYLSFELGEAKPDAVIYHKVIQALEVPAESLFFIDDLKDNIDTANNCGINGFWLSPDKTLQDYISFIDNH